MRATARVVASVRSRRRRLGDPLRQLVLDLDRTPERARRRIAPRPTAGVVCSVYRPQHASRVLALVADAQRAGLVPRLWALDAVEPTLARWTIGHGPGCRQALLNRLLPAAVDGWVVLADDDVELRRGSLAHVLAVAARLGFDLAQPAHDGLSHASTDFVRARPLVAARRTGFVEIGPIVALDAKAQDALLPLDESLGMGWGQDVLWARAVDDDGLTAGIVDAVRMRHLSPSHPTYDRAEAAARRDECLARVGYRSFDEPLVTHARWRARDLP